MALGLALTKEEGYEYLANVCQGKVSMSEFHAHVRSLLASRNVVINEENIKRPF